MAWIKKLRARRELERDIPTVSITNYAEDGGLRFNLTIGEHKVSLTHMERDIVVQRWSELEKDFING